MKDYENVIDSLKGSIKKESKKLNDKTKLVEKLTSNLMKYKEHATKQSYIEEIIKKENPELYWKAVLTFYPNAINVPEQYKKYISNEISIYSRDFPRQMTKQEMIEKSRADNPWVRIKNEEDLRERLKIILDHYLLLKEKWIRIRKKAIKPSPSRQMFLENKIKDSAAKAAILYRILKGNEK